MLPSGWRDAFEEWLHFQRMRCRCGIWIFSPAKIEKKFFESISSFESTGSSVMSKRSEVGHFQSGTLRNDWRYKPSERSDDEDLLGSWFWMASYKPDNAMASLPEKNFDSLALQASSFRKVFSKRCLVSIVYRVNHLMSCEVSFRS